MASSKLRKLFQNVRKITEKMVIKFSRNRCINPTTCTNWLKLETWICWRSTNWNKTFPSNTKNWREQPNKYGGCYQKKERKDSSKKSLKRWRKSTTKADCIWEIEIPKLLPANSWGICAHRTGSSSNRVKYSKFLRLYPTWELTTKSVGS